uniref:EF-hand domain-containing protein n=1 Tax=Globisporangium ultimum (strain ATCC 200006 / CBS 805.95 / DAOM BR144) TaxID=431595 RepID=K3X6I7_GLOUD
MGGGLSKSADLPPPTPAANAAYCAHKEPKPPKAQTAIDGRIVETLRSLSLKRREAHAKTMNFERIALKFGLAHDAFETIHGIYHQFADQEKGGLDYEGLKAALNGLGAHMDEKDMREIFYESDMVRDNSLSKNEFVVSLAISFVLGLITTFDHITRSLVHIPGEVTVTVIGEHLETPRDSNADIQSPREPRSARDTSCFTEDSPELIAKALELVVNAYLLLDDDASGTIQVNEVRNIMQKHNNTSTGKLMRKASGMNSKAIQGERMKELDVDQDGTITFQEFVLTFQEWVSTGDEEDVEQED